MEEEVDNPNGEGRSNNSPSPHDGKFIVTRRPA